MKKALSLFLILIPVLIYGQKDRFIPDTSIAGIKLQDPISLKLIIPDIRILTDYTGPGSHAYLLNKDESESVTLTFHAGSRSEIVAEIQLIGREKGKIKGSKTIKLNIDSFVTESNIKLNLNKNDLVKIKGTNYELEKINDKEILRYFIDNFETSSFLQRYNYPNYYANYIFKDNKLTKIEFGFTYP
jgi:hypothetical protein